MNNWKQFFTTDGNWFQPTIPANETVAVKVTYRDGKKDVLNIPVTQDILSHSTVGKSHYYVSQLAIGSKLPFCIASYSIPETIN